VHRPEVCRLPEPCRFESYPGSHSALEPHNKPTQKFRTSSSEGNQDLWIWARCYATVFLIASPNLVLH